MSAPMTPLLSEEKTEKTPALLPLSSRILTAIHWAAGATPVRKAPSAPLSMEATTMLSPVMPNPFQTVSVGM